MPDSAQKPVAAVIDIGSNTIKMLVATTPGLTVLDEATEETRISTGIGGSQMRLRPDCIAAGIGAIERLWNRIQKHNPSCCAITATSAVRDAENRLEFTVPVERVTGCTPRTLTGDEEARYIGLGVSQDPNIDSRRPFYLMDLGGGSLELLEFHGGVLRQKVSLQLGCVRLMEKFLPNPGQPMLADEADAVAEYVAEAVSNSGFSFRNPAAMVGTGGGMTISRILLGHSVGKVPDSPATLKLGEMRALFRRLAAMTLEERCKVAGMPKNRADIMPIALCIMTTVMELATASSVVHSFYNLRYGLAAELLLKARAD